jgi:hypothetical protein
MSSVCFMLALVLAWRLAGVRSSRFVRKCFPNPQYLLKAHLDILMMTGFCSRRLLRNRRKGVSMPYVIGIVLSAGVAVFARVVGFDRDRAFYPTVMIVIAAYYVLFAAMSGSVQTVVLESVVMTLFAAAAVAGFKSSAWIVVAALAGHGVFDAVHGYVIENAGVPAWWPAWCLAYDVGAAAGLAWLLQRGLVANDVRA